MTDIEPQGNAANAPLIKVFVSYSRSDSPLATAIVHALEQRRCQCTLDARDLPYGEKWKEELAEFVRGADAVVFLVSPRSVASPWCKWELSQVHAHSKRLVPVVVEPVAAEQLPPEISEVQLFGIGGAASFESSMDALAKVLLVDYAWVKEHTRLADRAAGWIRSQRSRDHLIGGRALREAEAWLARRPPGAPALSQEQLDFLMASQLAAKRRTRKVAAGLAAVVIGAIALALVANDQRIRAELRERVATATTRDAVAAKHLSEAGRAESGWDAEQARRVDLARQVQALGSPHATGAQPEDTAAVELRKGNLSKEIAETDETLRRLREAARSSRALARAELEAGDRAWREVRNGGGEDAFRARQQPAMPRLFSIEILGVGFGESLLLHYGDPDSPSFILVDSGQPRNFERTLQPRLLELKERWSAARALPLEAVIITNQDDDRIGGFQRMLRQMAASADDAARPYAIRRAWYNGFAPAFPGWQKSEVLQNILALGIPLNQPFDALVMRPKRGRVTVDLGKGLTATILNPDRERLEALHKTWVEMARKRDQPPPLFPEERFSKVSVMPAPSQVAPPELADDAHRGGYRDRSVVNLASIAILYEFAGRRFLHPGDSRGDQIIEGLAAAGLLSAEGTFTVDALLLPHAGSNNNVTPDFFARVRARQYLISAHGRHGLRTEPIRMILDARKGDAYTLNFLNRDGERNLGAALDAFLSEHPPEQYGYRRVFRASGSGSLFVDFADRVRY